jgi:acetolactate synthase-1/3 small subunit
MTVVSRGSDEVIEQITKQLNKLVDVVKLQDLTEFTHIEREMMLVKIVARSEDREELKRLSDIFRGRIIDVTNKSYTVELTGPGEKLDAFIKTLGNREIIEVVRSGTMGIARGDEALKL